MWKKVIGSALLISVLFTLGSCMSNDSNREEELEENRKDQSEEEYDTSKEIIHKNNEFGLRVIDKLSEEEEKNHFISPISLYIALSMVYPSADNETKEEMSTLLGAEDMSIEAWNEANMKLLQVLNEEKEESVNIHLANSLWLDEHYQLNENYEQVMEQNFKGKIANINSNEQLAVREMNEWVSEQTNGNIDEVVEAPLSEDFVAMLINAVYFNGKWTYPFNPEVTENSTFYLANEEEVEVPFMNIQEEFNYVKESNYEAVRLPYGEEEDVSMYLFKPTEDNDITSIYKALDQGDLHEVIADMQLEEGVVSLPTFQLEFEKELNELLKDLGMKQAFDKEEADFPKMIDGDERVYISEVNHMTYLDINEEGTEAAGSSTVGMDIMSISDEEPFELTFDTPFIMLIVDEESEGILFIGDIQDVSA